MFAPITRSYSTPFAGAPAAGTDLPPFQRNALTFPRSPQQNLAFLAAWQRMFRGSGFDFDYHFMWDHHRDAGQYAMAQVLHQDCVHLRDIGLDGMVSCQNQRVFFPTGLGMTAMGRTLWNRSMPFDAIARDYFQAAFGAEGERVRAYLQAISEHMAPRLIRGEGNAEEKAAACCRLQHVPDLVGALRPHLESGRRHPDPAVAASWRILEDHSQFVLLFADALLTLYGNDVAGAKQKAWELFRWCRDTEPRLHPVFDVFEFQTTLAPLFGIPRSEVQ